jgi:hypothetical protein
MEISVEVDSLCICWGSCGYDENVEAVITSPDGMAVMLYRNSYAKR